jgi:hypothetical protein
MRKRDKSPKNERETRPEMSREQEPVRTAVKRMITLSANGSEWLQTKSKENDQSP